jgi:hypothetical protein
MPGRDAGVADAVIYNSIAIASGDHDPGSFVDLVSLCQLAVSVQVVGAEVEEIGKPGHFLRKLAGWLAEVAVLLSTKKENFNRFFEPGEYFSDLGSDVFR